MVLALLVVSVPTFVPMPAETAVNEPAGSVKELPTSASVKTLEVFWTANVTWKNSLRVLIVPSMIKMPGITGPCGG